MLQQDQQHLITYQWQSSSNGVNNWIDINLANGPSFVPPTLTSTETIYYRRQTLANGGGAGCEAFSDVHEIRVNDIQPGSIDPNSTATYCFGSNPGSINSITEATSSFGAISYQWQSRTDSSTWTNITINGTSATYTPTAPITQKIYYKRITKSTRGGGAIVCQEESNVIAVSPETLPTAVLKGYPGIPPAGEVTATGTLTVCVGETAYFYGSGTGAAEYQFLIGGVEAQARSAVSTYTSSGLNTGDQVTVRTYNAAGCFVESEIINIVTTTPPVIDFSSSLPDNITFCSNTAITFTASSTGATNYNFTIDGGSVQSGASSTFLAVAGTVSNRL